MNASDCTICMETFGEKKQRPRILPCGHTLCTKCIDQSIVIGNKSCPTCRKPYKASKVSDIPVNFLVEDILKEKLSAKNKDKIVTTNKTKQELVEHDQKKIATVNTLKNDDTHYSTFCDCCFGPVSGFRYKCLICVDYDLCKNCEKNIHHTQHPMLRIPSPQTKYDIAKKMDIKCEISLYDCTFVHEGIICDCCEGSVVGYRYKCFNCPNFDLCHTCEHEKKHSHHLVVRLPATTESQIRYKRKRGAESYQDVGPSRLSVQLYEECKMQ